MSLITFLRTMKQNLHATEHKNESRLLFLFRKLAALLSFVLGAKCVVENISASFLTNVPLASAEFMPRVQGAEEVVEILGAPEVASISCVMKVMVRCALGVRETDFVQPRSIKTISAVRLVRLIESALNPKERETDVRTAEQASADSRTLVRKDLLDRMGVFSRETHGSDVRVMLLVYPRVQGLRVHETMGPVEEESVEKLSKDEETKDVPELR